MVGENPLNRSAHHPNYWDEDIVYSQKNIPKGRVQKDIMGYIDVDNGSRKLVLRSTDDTIDCKCRFSQIEPVIDFSYESLVEALNKAIDKEASMTGNKYVTEEKIERPKATVYDYDALMTEFQDIAGKLMAEKDQAVMAPKITQIIERYLGKGKKISDTTPDQAEFVYLILNDIKQDLM